MTAEPRHIRLELAREPGHPHGDAACRDGAERCRVRRFVGDQTAATGRLRHTTGDRWLFDFPGEQADATGFRLGDERFVPGEYVSVITADGETHTYLVERVVEI